MALSTTTKIGAPLTRRFFARQSPVVAQALLGKVLVCGDRAGVVVETEAYLGEQDGASHARFGRTARSEVMYGPPGVAYVYLCYGVHDLFNVVTGSEGYPQAVLVRALEPLDDLARNPKSCSGPGKLTRQLKISRIHNHLDLTSPGPVRLCHGKRFGSARVIAGPRIGVSYAGRWANEPLRFWIKNHPAVTG